MSSAAKITALFVTFVCFCMPLWVHAAQDKPTGGEAQPEQTTKQTTEQKSVEPAKPEIASKQSKKQKSSDVFRPSEEISEDFNVSFPVDI